MGVVGEVLCLYCYISVWEWLELLSFVCIKWDYCAHIAASEGEGLGLLVYYACIA